MKAIISTLTLFCTLSLSTFAGNAALSYWQAFSLIPELDEDAQSKLRQWNTIDMNDELTGGVLTIQPALRYLHQGSRENTCDWGIDWSQGFATMLPHLSKARELAMLAAVRGRMHASAGETEQAATIVIDIISLGRHVGQNGSLISFLVQGTVEDIGRQLAGLLLGSFSDEDLKYLAKELDALAQNTLADAMINEQKVMLSSFKGDGLGQVNAERILFLSRFLSTFGTTIDEVNGGSLQTMRTVIQSLSDDHYAQIAALFRWPKDRAEILQAVNDTALVRQQVSIEQLEMVLFLSREGLDSQILKEQVNELEAISHELIRLASLDHAAFQQAYPALEEQVAHAGQLTQTIIPAVDGAFKRSRKMDQAQAALKAAVQWRLTGSAAGFESSEHNDTLTLAAAETTHTFTLNPVEIRGASAIDVDDQMLADALKDIKAVAISKPGEPAYAGFREGLRKGLGELLGGLDLKISDQDGKKALDIIMEDAVVRAGSWQRIFESALAGDASSRSAAVIFAHADDIEKQLLALVVTQQQDALGKVIGQNHTERILAEIDRKLGK